MKTKIYLLVFALLAIFAAYTIYTNSSSLSTEEEKAFKVENFEEVTKIIITNRKGEELVLDKEAENWILNNKFPVRKHLFEEMQEALTKMEAVSPVPEVGKQNVLKQMIEGAIKVEVFKGKNLDKKIFVGGPNLQNTASHMFLEINSKPANRIYNVSIPGFRGFLTTRFNVDESEWRSKVILDLKANEIKSVDVDYTKKSTYEDFTITNNNSEFELTYNVNKFKGAILNEKNIVNYLNLFSNQQVTSYVFTEKKEHYLKDSLMQVNKVAEVTVTDIKDQTINISVINMPRNESSKQQYDENGDPMLYDVDYRFIEFGPNKDWGVITNSKFGLTLVSPSFFINNNSLEQ